MLLYIKNSAKKNKTKSWRQKKGRTKNREYMLQGAMFNRIAERSIFRRVIRQQPFLRICFVVIQLL